MSWMPRPSQRMTSLEPRRDPVDAGHHGLYDLHALETGEDVGSVASPEEENPEVDRERGRGVARNPDDLGLGGKVYEQFGGEVFIDADAHHELSLHERGSWKPARKSTDKLLFCA